MSGGGALDSSVTLEEVFTVVGARRVPLAPELAGYLVLEIAEHADPGGGEVDPKSIFVSEEGTVALIKPRREGPAGDAEVSIRTMLARLLEASGSHTPALSAACRRKNLAGLPGLAEELETALIPVNRAAGRRALARLAREVRRVTLGVGRNALPSVNDAIPSSRRASLASHPSNPAHAPLTPPASEPPAPRSSSHAFSREEDPTTARGKIPSELLVAATPSVADQMPTMQFDLEGRDRSPSQADVDSLISDFGVSGGADHEHARDLKAIAGLDATPPPPGERALKSLTASARAPETAPNDDAVETLLAMNPDATPGNDARRARATSSASPASPALPAPPAPSARASREVQPRPASPAQGPRVDTGGAVAGGGARGGSRRGEDGRQLPTQPSQIKRPRGSMHSAPHVASAGRGSSVAVVLAIAAIAAGAYGVWRLRPSSADAVADPGAASSVALAPSSVASAHPAAACRATLIVADVPPRAEVLLRQGQAPVDVEKMPVGARLEFVATAEGYAPKRVVVPAGAQWDTGADGKPRFESAVQLDKSNLRPGVNDPWPPVEAGTEVGGQGPPGTIHVVATPRGAEIWMLAGVGPEAHVDQLRCDRDFDILVAGPGAFRKRLRVAGADFAIDASADGTAAPKAGSPASAPAKSAIRVARVSAR